MPWVSNIEKDTIRNRNYRKVIATTKTMQLVLMSLKPGEEIGWEKHPHATQFIRIEQGKGVFEYGTGKAYKYISDGMAFIVPPNTMHNVRNIGNTDLKLYTLYAPPTHSRGLVQRTKPRR